MVTDLVSRFGVIALLTAASCTAAEKFTYNTLADLYRISNTMRFVAIRSFGRGTTRSETLERDVRVNRAFRAGTNGTESERGQTIIVIMP
jgi:hypothetical protein